MIFDQLCNLHMFHCKLLNFILVKLWEFKVDCLHCVSFKRFKVHNANVFTNLLQLYCASIVP